MTISDPGSGCLGIYGEFLSAMRNLSGKGPIPGRFPSSSSIRITSPLFIDAEMGKFFLNSVLVTALALILLLVIALPASYALSRFEFRGKKILNTAFMAGLFVNINYIVVPIFLMLSDANKALGVSFFLDNRFLLSLIYASSSLSFSIYLLSGYFKTLPKGYEEAAYIDGCGYFKTMLQIMIPYGKAQYPDGDPVPVLVPSGTNISLLLPSWMKTVLLAVGLKNLMAVERTATNYGINVCRSGDRYDPGTDPL